MPQTNQEIEDTLNDKYMAHLIVAKKKDALWELCQSFIIQHHVTCAEAIYDGNRDDSDHCEFIKGMADIVGYFTFPEDETTTGK